MKWQFELARLLASGRPEDFSEALAIRDQHLPERIYKFFSPSDYAFDSLAACSVWLASPYTFNDPFDSGLIVGNIPFSPEAICKVTPEAFTHLDQLGLSPSDLMCIVNGRVDGPLLTKVMALTPEAERDGLRQFLDVAPAVFGQILGKIAAPVAAANQRGLKVACFSERADSLLLWSHYADAHRGFCVEYCPADLEPAQPQRRLLFPVIYSSARFDAAPFFERASLKTTFLPTHTFLGAIHKAVDWNYEREWRMINPDGSDEKGMLVPMAKPRAVHAGVRMDDAHRERLAAICSSLGVRKHDVKLSEARYEVLLQANTNGAA